MPVTLELDVQPVHRTRPSLIDTRNLSYASGAGVYGSSQPFGTERCPIRAFTQLDSEMLLTPLTIGALLLATPPQHATSSPVLASGPDPRIASITAIAVRTPRAPVIDGRGDDATWQAATKISAFRQFAPHVDAEPSFKTEFQVAYDERNLYVFVRMYDPHPDSIMHALSRRDVRGPSDQIKIIVDSYGDRRSGYEFAVNPDGVKRDYAISNDNQEDDSWNGIWDAATNVDSLGWTAEFRIPLSQLRYAHLRNHTF